MVFDQNEIINNVKKKLFYNSHNINIYNFE